MPLILVCIAWIAGALFSPIHMRWLLLTFAGLIPLFLLFFLPDRRKFLILLTACVFIFIGGSAYYQWRLPAADANHLQFYNGQDEIEINGIVSGDPEQTDKSIQLQVSASTLNAAAKKVSGNVLVIIPKPVANSTYGYGDLLRVKGKLETPPSIEGFDYKAYLNNHGIYSIMYSPEVQIIEKAHGFKPLALVYQLRESLSRSLARTLPEPQASLAQGIILGLRGNIPTDVENQFIRTGTAHLLAISGVNLTIMAAMLISLGVAVFGRRYQIYAWLAIFAIWFYALITGFQPPVVRAAIMASIFLVAELLGRQRSAVGSLILAATLMVIFTPQLVHDASFQLTVMSMVGLVLVAPPLQSLSKRLIEATLPDKFADFFVPVADSLVVSLGSIIAIWPLIAFYFGIVSWIGPIATLLTVAAMPAIIVAGSACGVLGIFVLPLSQFTAWFVWLFLSYVLLIVRIADYVPFTQVHPFPYQWIFAYYSVLALSLCAYRSRHNLVKSWERLIDFAWKLPLKPITSSLFLIAVLLFSTAVTLPDNKLHVAFLDVGQGDAVLITEGSQQILIDGGPSGEAVCSQLSRYMPFWDRTIDLVISTHPHADHLSGLLEVLKRYRVKQVLYGDFNYDSPLVLQWNDLISQKQIESTKAQAGQQIAFGDASLQILNPQVPLFSDTDSDIDNNGIVTRLTMGKISFLFMADVRQEAERQLISLRSLPTSNVLKIGHHGSTTSSSAQLLSAVNPNAAVISVGKDNEFGHPNEDVIARLKEIVGISNPYRTDLQGTIEFSTDGNSLWVKTSK
ncbi:MAG: DNA internalization-related competence protein ComEC/Rec2 [Dehalococcoidales bacterium]|nr:DNA internalization-related competence protein ComEC/Rec2 [Dehalococcoidales bacterium]